MASDKSPLKAFLGTHDGKPAIFISPFPLRQLSDMHIHENLPAIVQRFREGKEEDLADVLKALDKYYK